MKFEYSGIANGQLYDRVYIMPQSTRAYGMKDQPPESEIKRIFTEDILPTLSQYTIATSLDQNRNEYMHAISCTSGQIGFSTGYRDTIFKVVDGTLIVIHHYMRRPNQYSRLKKQFYPHENDMS